MQSVQVPEWLSRDFLKACLESDKKNFPEVAILDFSVESAVPSGNNYGSLMLRTKIQYEIPCRSTGEKVMSLIIKAPLVGGFSDLIPEVYDEFVGTEPRYYNEFISETYKLKDHDIVPRCYTSPIPNSVVMEDLITKGFVMVDRKKLLDFDHCALFAKESSKLHAFSIMMRKTKPGLIERLGKPNKKMKDSFDKIMKTMMFNGLQCMATFLENFPAYKEFMDVLKVLAENDNLWRMNCEVEETEWPLMAVTQGDPWCTNMMFKYNSSGKVEAIKILDFQYLRFTSPVLEFVSFLWMSANMDVRTSKLQELSMIYNNSLNENLADLGCSERLSYKDQVSEAKTLSPVVFMVVCCMVPGVIADEELDPNAFNESSKDVPTKESIFWNYFQGTNFTKYYPKVLDIVKQEGFLEDMLKRVRSIKQNC